MRDRLIELIKAGKKAFAKSDVTYIENYLADHLIANGVTVQEWNSVKDRLPDNDDWVLVCRKTIKTGYTTMVVDRCTFTVGGDRVWLAEYATYKQVVTHWMPLPQPPKGE